MKQNVKPMLLIMLRSCSPAESFYMIVPPQAGMTNVFAVLCTNLRIVDRIGIGFAQSAGPQ